MEQLITVENLHKSYGSKTVLDEVSFTAQPGQIIGLLGPNGCGKTTLIKILTGLIKDHTGTVRINNEEPGAYSKSIVAYLPEKTYLPDWMRPVDAINYFADFYKDFDKDKAIAMVARFGLDMKQRVKTMSEGQQEKLRLLLVICRNAQLFILDEPLGGVDPAADMTEFKTKGNVWTMLAGIGACSDSRTPFLWTRNGGGITENDFGDSQTTEDDWSGKLTDGVKPFATSLVVMVSKGAAMFELKATDLSNKTFLGGTTNATTAIEIVKACGSEAGDTTESEF